MERCELELGRCRALFASDPEGADVLRALCEADVVLTQIRNDVDKNDANAFDDTFAFLLDLKLQVDPGDCDSRTRLNALVSSLERAEHEPVVLETAAAATADETESLTASNSSSRVLKRRRSNPMNSSKRRRSGSSFDGEDNDDDEDVGEVLEVLDDGGASAAAGAGSVISTLEGRRSLDASAPSEASLGVGRKRKVMVMVDDCKYLVFYGRDATVAWLRERAEQRHVNDTVRLRTASVFVRRHANRRHVVQGRRPLIRRLTFDGASLDDEFLIADLVFANRKYALTNVMTSSARSRNGAREGQ